MQILWEMEIGDPIDVVEVGSAVLSTSSVRRVKPTLRTCMGLIVLLGSLQRAEEVSHSLVHLRADAGQENLARNLQLRGGGRHHKAKEKAVYHDKVLKSIAKERKERKINKPDRRSTCRASADLRPQKKMRTF